MSIFVYICIQSYNHTPLLLEGYLVKNKDADLSSCASLFFLYNKCVKELLKDNNQKSSYKQKIIHLKIFVFIFFFFTQPSLTKI